MPALRLRSMCGAASALLLLAACTSDDPSASSTTSTIAPTTTTLAPRSNDGVLRLGAFLPRTGPGASLGEPMLTAVNQAVGDINAAGGVLGHVVSITPADESSGTGLDELLQAGVDAIIGPASSTVALSQLADAVNPVTGVVTCSPSATALALDDFPDNKLFFRTIPSDSLQMKAIERQVEGTGVESVAIGYLDDPYGRALYAALASEFAARNRVDVRAEKSFGADQENLSDTADQLLAADPEVIVVLGDADDGTRLLAALDAATPNVPLEAVVVNDAIRGGRQGIAVLSSQFRELLQGVGPMALPIRDDGPPGFFASNAVDCVNLIALAAIQAGSDDPAEIQRNMASVSVGGASCTSFADCATKLGAGRRIDYSGLSGDVELSSTTGDLVSGMFTAFNFDDEGVDHQIDAPFPVS